MAGFKILVQDHSVFLCTVKEKTQNMLVSTSPKGHTCSDGERGTATGCKYPTDTSESVISCTTELAVLQTHWV